MVEMLGDAAKKRFVRFTMQTELSKAKEMF